MFINTVGKEYQVTKTGRECHGCREEYIMEKGKGKLGRISSGEWDGIFGEENQDLK